MTEKVSTILEGLNSEQKRAVSCVDGPVLIVAGAGSGKTRVLTSRIAFVIEKGCNPSRILALTFTKKAATEMKERIAAMVGERNARKIYMGTFHSVFIRFLREYAEFLGYPKDFTIYDQSDSQALVKTCVRELNLDEKIYKPKEVQARISMAKNNLVTPGAYAKNATAMQNDLNSKKPKLVDIYALYCKKAKASGVMDFDDLLLQMNVLLRDNPAALEEIASRFDHIMVDEYQDTNYAQYLILKKLSQWHRNICVVGDDSQSIYAFRGAKIENILNFQKDYPENHTFRLEQNYRSTRVIVDAANTLIAKNKSRIPKTCYSEGDPGEKIKLLQTYTEQEESYQIVSDISRRIYSDHAQYQDFAILYRTNAQSRSIEEQLRKKNIPYVIYSGHSFFDRAEVKDMMAYFKLAANPSDDESFRRVVNKPLRGIGDTSVTALAAAASAYVPPVMAASAAPSGEGASAAPSGQGASAAPSGQGTSAAPSGQGAAPALVSMAPVGCSLFKAAALENLPQYGLRQAAIDRIRAFCALIAKYAARARTEDAYAVATGLAMESGLLGMYKEDTSIEGQSRVGNIEELLNSVKQYIEERHNSDFEELQLSDDFDPSVELTDADLPIVTLGDYLENISLLSAVDMESEEDTNNKVSLMTAHSSKGLEFPYVYVAGMEENLFPSGGFLAAESDIEEERRLFYVAMTRAKKVLTISLAATRMRNGKTESNAPSRFLREIDRQYFLNPLPTGVSSRNDSDDDDFEDYDPVERSIRSQWRKESPRSAPRPGARFTGSSASRPSGLGSGSRFGSSGPSSSGAGSRFGSSGPSSSGSGSRFGSSGPSSSGSGSRFGGSISRPSGIGGGSRPGGSLGGSRPSGIIPTRPFGLGGSKPVAPRTSDADFQPTPVRDLRAGQRVEHNRFGAGRILEISGDLTNLKAKIAFDDYGEKILLLQYAKLRVITD